MYSYMHHDMGYAFNIENFMRQHDGDFIYCTFVQELPESGQGMGQDLGDIFYKVSASTHSVTDSLFVDNPNAPFYLFAPNPHGSGNIRANFEYHEDCDSTFLRICHFPDNDLNINHDEDIVTPVCEGSAHGNFDSHFVDCRGDLIMKYSKQNSGYSSNEFIARFGSDGTLKHQALLFENMDIVIPKMRVFSESPLQYYEWRSYDENLRIYLIDSLFNKSTITINRILSEEVISPNPPVSVAERLEFNYDTEVIPVGGNDILVAAKYVNDTNNYPMTAEYGVAVAKFDIRTMQLKDYRVFNDHLGYYNEGICLGLKMMPDGTVYFLYKEAGYPSESIIIVKMDTNLQMEWKRFCKTENLNLYYPLVFPVLCEDEQKQGIAWAGYSRNTDYQTSMVLFYLSHDGTVGANENGMDVRPYAFYPNPAKEKLHFEFSPDVQPAQVELYDLQGHLVCTQSNTFENIDMSQLPTGTYMLRVTLEDGKVFSDKVIKK